MLHMDKNIDIRFIHTMSPNARLFNNAYTSTKHKLPHHIKPALHKPSSDPTHHQNILSLYQARFFVLGMSVFLN